MADHAGLAAYPVRLPPNYSYKIVHVNKNTAEIRIKEVTDSTSAEKWINDYNTHTKQTFKTGKTFPVCGRVNVFKKGYRCHRNTRTSCVKHKNTNCKAWINLTVRRCGDFSRKYSRAKKPDPLLPDWPAIVEMKHEHNHPADSLDTFKYRPVSQEVKEKLLDLYRRGHSPTTAYNILKFDLMTEGVDFEVKVMDRHFLPDLKFCYRLFYKCKQLEKHKASPEVASTIESLIEGISKYCKLNSGNGGNILFDKNGDEFCVAICTPLMGRVHANLLEAGEFVLVERSVCSEKSGIHRYMFLTKSAAGILPLAVGLTTSQTESGLRTLFNLMQTSLPAMTAFAEKGPQVGPDVFIIDDDLQLIQRALRAVWNNSDIILSPMRILKMLWRWLLNKSSCVLDDHRTTLFALFKQAVHSTTVQELQVNCDIILQNTTAQTYPKYLSYINGLWERRTEWALCYHPHFLQLHSFISLSEGFLKALKEKLLMNTKTLDGGELLDIFTVRMEKCYETCLLDICHMREGVLTKRLASNQNEQIWLEQIDDEVFSVRTDENVCVVDMSVLLCTCPVGQNGKKMCKHQVAVIQDKSVGELMVTISQLPNLRQALYVIATAKEPPPQWLYSASVDVEGNYAVESAAVNTENVIEESSDDYQGVVQFEEVKFDGKGTTSIKVTEVKQKLRMLCNEWEQKVDSDPLVYVSAFDKFLTNYQETCTDDGQLVAALCRFGEQSSLELPSSLEKLPAHLTFHDYSIQSPSSNAAMLSNSSLLPLVTDSELQGNDRPTSLNEIVAQFVLNS